MVREREREESVEREILDFFFRPGASDGARDHGIRSLWLQHAIGDDMRRQLGGKQIYSSGKRALRKATNNK